MNFYDHLIYNKGYSPITAKNYSYWIAKYQGTDIAKLKVSANTKKAIIHSMNAYNKFLNKEKIDIEIPKISSKTQLYMDSSLYHSIMNDTILNNESHTKAIKLFVWLCYKHGLRVSEALDAKIEDITNDYICVRGKGNKERLIPLNREMKKYLPCSGYIVKINGTKGSYSTIHLLWTDTIKQVTKTKYKIHSMRHGFAMHLIENGLDIYSISKLLGHTSLQATEKYLHFNINSLIKKMEDLNLLG